MHCQSLQTTFWRRLCVPEWHIESYSQGISLCGKSQAKGACNSYPQAFSNLRDNLLPFHNLQTSMEKISIYLAACKEGEPHTIWQFDTINDRLSSRWHHINSTSSLKSSFLVRGDTLVPTRLNPPQLHHDPRRVMVMDPGGARKVYRLSGLLKLQMELLTQLKWRDWNFLLNSSRAQLKRLHVTWG